MQYGKYDILIGSILFNIMLRYISRAQSWAGCFSVSVHYPSLGLYFVLILTYGFSLSWFCPIALSICLSLYLSVLCFILCCLVSLLYSILSLGAVLYAMAFILSYVFFLYMLPMLCTYLHDMGY
jgi:hypothetical protein